MIMYKYNLGRFRLMYGHDVYFMLWKIIPIFIMEFKSGMTESERLKKFHELVYGHERRKKDK